MTGHLRGDARKRDDHHIHPDAGVRALIERERRAAAVEAWDECLAAVTRGVESAKDAHAERGHRAIVSSLVGLMDAIPRTENPYRADRMEAS